MLAEVMVVDGRLMGGAVGGGPDAPPMAGPTPERTRYPDAQLFVGNLPLNTSKFGNMLKLRVNERRRAPVPPPTASSDDSCINLVLGTLPPPVTV